MSFGLRGIFPAANAGLRGFAAPLGVPSPVSIRSLAAHQAISTQYQTFGGFRGRLGAFTSPVTAAPAAQFQQAFRGGNLVFTDSGQVDLTNGVLLRFVYQGIHAFGNPGGIANSDVYAIITLLGIEQQVVLVKKVPEDGTDDLYKNLTAGQSSTQGQFSFFEVPSPPQTLALNVKVFHAGLLGADSQDAKAAIVSATEKVAGLFAGVIPGSPVDGSQAQSIGQSFGNFVSNLLGLNDVEVGEEDHTFITIAELEALPPANSLTENGITHNFATPDPITNGDASYKMYFNIEVLPVGAAVHS